MCNMHGMRSICDFFRAHVRQHSDAYAAAAAAAAAPSCRRGCLSVCVLFGKSWKLWSCARPQGAQQERHMPIARRSRHGHREPCVCVCVVDCMPAYMLVYMLGCVFRAKFRKCESPRVHERDHQPNPYTPRCDTVRLLMMRTSAVFAGASARGSGIGRVFSADPRVHRVFFLFFVVRVCCAFCLARSRPFH